MARGDKNYGKVVRTPKSGMKKKIHAMIEALIDGNSEAANTALHEYLREKTQSLISENGKDDDDMDTEKKNGKKKEDDEDADEDEDKDDDMEDEDDEDKEDADEDEDDMEDEDDEDKDGEDDDADLEESHKPGHKMIKFAHKKHHNAGLNLKKVAVKKVGMK